MLLSFIPSVLTSEFTIACPLVGVKTNVRFVTELLPPPIVGATITSSVSELITDPSVTFPVGSEFQTTVIVDSRPTPPGSFSFTVIPPAGLIVKPEMSLFITRTATSDGSSPE